jgi:NAD(P)-dependent dehydrogenase (short-subunit alcohol dehydrogenase family)
LPCAETGLIDVAAKTLSSLYSHAFVTGASGGLGLAFAKMLLGEGIRVTGTARDVSRLGSLAKDPRFTPVALDLAQPAAAERVFADAAAAAGPDGFDLVINNAGYGLFGAFGGVDYSVWQGQLDALLGTTARLSHAALRNMEPRRRGCLVNISSLAVEFPLPFMSGYNMAKAGLSALSESLIFETRGTGVTVIDFIGPRLIKPCSPPLFSTQPIRGSFPCGGSWNRIWRRRRSRWRPRGICGVR